MKLELTRILHADAAVNAAAGLALVTAADVFVAPLGLTTVWPLRLLGALLVVYGVENALVARNPTRHAILGLVAVDAAFTAGVVALAIVDPTGAETWLRWTLIVVAGLAAMMGIAKAVTGRVSRFAAVGHRPVSSGRS